MKKRLLTLWFALLACAGLGAQEDSLYATRYVMRSFLFGAGHANVLDTYLSPLEYEGPEVRLMYENMRMTKLLGGQCLCPKPVAS